VVWIPKEYSKLKKEIKNFGPSNYKGMFEKIESLKYDTLREAANNFWENGQNFFNRIMKDSQKGKIKEEDAKRLEGGLLKGMRKSLDLLLAKEAAVYALLFIFVAAGIYSAVYLRDSITGFAVFTNNSPGFDLASLLFIGVFVFFVYLFIHSRD